MIRLRTTMLVGLWLTGVVYAQGERERVTARGGQTPFSQAGQSAADKAVDIGSRLELFVDRLLVDHLDHVEFRLHRPQRVPLGETPLFGSYATVIKDGDLYRAYYRAVKPGYSGSTHDGHPGEITCYQESTDGANWVKPNLGLIEIDGSRENNVILAQPGCCHNFSPFLDTRPDVDPAERFKALAGVHRSGGLRAFVSADGIRWRTIRDEPVITSADFAFDSQNVAFWSETEACYVCYFRTWETPHGRLRTISRTTSTDFLNWSKPVPMHPNLPGEHLYTNQTHPYFRAPHLYVALPTRFMHGKIRGQAVKGNIGSTDILFMTSRAGTTSYERLFTEAFIRPGLDPERWGNRSNYAALNVVPTGESEISIYHQKSGHRYVLRTDGFISIQAGAAPGELGTKPLRFRGSHLVLNYSTSAAGSVQVEIQDAVGNPLPGFRLKDCQPLVGDQIAGTVGWQGAPDLGALAGQPVRLRFVMTECDLYSFRFADE